MNRKEKNLPFDIINYGIFGLFTIFCVFPLYYIFILTISDNSLASCGKILLYPQGIHFSNYVKVVQLRGIGQAALISILKTSIGTTLTLIGSAFLGYLITKKSMYARKFVYRAVVVTMYFNAGLIPWFINMRNLGLTDNFLGYVLPYIIIPFYLILFKTYIESIPPSMEESAAIEGAGLFTIFIRIVIPLSRPILATIMVFESVNQWNNFTDNLFLMRKQSLTTLQYLLYRYLNEAEGIANTMRHSGFSNIIAPSVMLTPTAIRMTIAMVVIFPILMVYPFMQRYFVKGIMIGAVKG